MQLLSNRLEDSILTFLLTHGPSATGGLLEQMQQKHSCTKQGFYKALRKLKEEERVVTYKSIVSINELWRKQIRALVEDGQADSTVLGDFSALADGEEISLTLRGLIAMDRVWAHAFSIIEDRVPKTEHLFLFNPHNWSGVLRAESDRTHDSLLGRQGRKAYLAIGSASALDKLATRNLALSNIEVSYSPRVRQEAYVAVISDYLIEVRFNPMSRKAVDLIFKTETDIDTAKRNLERLDKKVFSKVTIVKDARRASQWRRRISLDFFIPVVN